MKILLFILFSTQTFGAERMIVSPFDSWGLSNEQASQAVRTVSETFNCGYVKSLSDETPSRPRIFRNLACGGQGSEGFSCRGAVKCTDPTDASVTLFYEVDCIANSPRSCPKASVCVGKTFYDSIASVQQYLETMPNRSASPSEANIWLQNGVESEVIE